MTKNIRLIRVEGKNAYVPLNQGYEAIIDSEDAHLVGRWNWYALIGKSTVYAFRSETHGGNGKQKSFYMHRAIMGDPKGLDVDHINSHGLDNQKSNLRLASHAENMRNAKISRLNTSGFKGVHWLKSAGKWQARIRTDSGRKHLGLFADAQDAYSAYCSAAEFYHGKFARLK